MQHRRQFLSNSVTSVLFLHVVGLSVIWPKPNGKRTRGNPWYHGHQVKDTRMSTLYQRFNTLLQFFTWIVSHLCDTSLSINLSNSATRDSCLKLVKPMSMSMSTVDLYSASPRPPLMRYMQSVFSE